MIVCRYLLTNVTLGQGVGGYIDGIIDYRYLLTTVTLGQGGLMIYRIIDYRYLLTTATLGQGGGGSHDMELLIIDTC